MSTSSKTPIWLRFQCSDGRQCLASTHFILRAEAYRALQPPVLACRFEDLSAGPTAVNYQPGDFAALKLRSAGLRILDVPAQEAEERLVDFHGTTVVRAAREVFGDVIKDRFVALCGKKRYFAMGAYDNALLGALYQAL